MTALHYDAVRWLMIRREQRRADVANRGVAGDLLWLISCLDASRKGVQLACRFGDADLRAANMHLVKERER